MIQDKDTNFVYIAIRASNEWLEAVTDEEYNKLEQDK